jgi:hypothetical protein
MRLREYAIAISTSPVFIVTLPMPLLGWAMRHLKSNVLIANEPCPAVNSNYSKNASESDSVHLDSCIFSPGGTNGLPNRRSKADLRAYAQGNLLRRLRTDFAGIAALYTAI